MIQISWVANAHVRYRPLVRWLPPGRAFFWWRTCNQIANHMKWLLRETFWIKSIIFPCKLESSNETCDFSFRGIVIRFHGGRVWTAYAASLLPGCGGVAVCKCAYPTWIPIWLPWSSLPWRCWVGRGGSVILLNDHAHDSDNDDKRMMMW